MLAELGLKGLRSDVVQKIFSQEIRFRADDGSEFPAPSIVPLSEVFDKITERNSQEAIKLVLTNSAELGIVPQRAFFDKDIAVEGNTQNYYIVRPGYFVYNPRTVSYTHLDVYKRQVYYVFWPTCYNRIYVI